MSSEESYRAILRYLTNEREPYAPGTEGNVKRKIRKAAACYVVRGGTLYYQRRQRHRKTFAELEVVLQPERRQGLIEAAHLGPGGTHHTRHQTWHDLSKTYWWRGRTWLAARGRAGGLVPKEGPLAEAGLRAPREFEHPVPLLLGGLAVPTFPRRRSSCQAEPRGWGTRKAPHFPQEGRGSWGRALAQGGARGSFPGGRASRGEGPGRAGCVGLPAEKAVGRRVVVDLGCRRWLLKSCLC